VSVTRVPYAAEGWGVGEIWLEGPRLVWHELPRPTAHPHPFQGWGSSPPPTESTIAGSDAHGGNGSGSEAGKLLHTLEAYFAGERVSFADVELDLDDLTPFQLGVARALRRVPYGEVVAYGELAALAGFPNAQRAAGTFCARNRYPLVLPCHRVVGATGIGSYGSLGVEYKRRLLEHEGVAL
jgi:methylated-DNA-[protein]-cysteine S-methyltransferase